MAITATGKALLLGTISWKRLSEIPSPAKAGLSFESSFQFPDHVGDRLGGSICGEVLVYWR